MNSRVHPKYKTKYRVENWPEYERGLIRRGNVTVWLTPEAVASWTLGCNGKRGGQRRYSDLAIETALTLRLVFHLPFRQAEGFLNSLFAIMGVELSAADHTTLSRRGQGPNVALRRVPTGEPVHLIVDSTGLSIVGEGEWAAAKHGGKGKRGWKKLHLGVDRSGAIVTQVLADGSADDAATAPGLIDSVNGRVASFTADAAYDTTPVYDAGRARGAKVLIPPTKMATGVRPPEPHAPAWSAGRGSDRRLTAREWGNCRSDSLRAPTPPAALGRLDLDRRSELTHHAAPDSIRRHRRSTSRH